MRQPAAPVPTSETTPAAGDTGAAAEESWAAFDRTTSRWGRLTMLAAIVLMIAGPAVLAVQVGVDPVAVLGAVLAIAAVFGVIWFVEPFAYFPILGPASMYQAFMIGNTSNKLLPAAVVAQSAIGAKPDTRRGQLAAVLAICGAATTHLAGLLVLVGILGSLLVRVLPADVTAIVQLYILPATIGAVVVQMIAGNRQPRILIISVVVGAIVVFVLTPLLPVVSSIAIALSVAATVLLAIVLPGGRKAEPAQEAETEDIS